MAEFVDFRISDVQPILEELMHTQIFDKDQIRSVISKLKHYEYKIQRRSRNLDVILDYISYESAFLKDIINRRKEMNYHHKKEEIDDALIHRISCQFGSAKKSFSHDIKFWKAIIEFNLKLKHWEKVSSLYKELLDLHGTKHPHLYSSASDFEFSRKRSRGIVPARQVYIQGLRIHPGNLLIAINAFILELKYVKYLHDNPTAKDKILTSINGEKIMGLQFPKTLYEDITRNEVDADVFLRFYNAAKSYDFARDLLKDIIADVQEKCKGSEKTYDYLAKMALKNGDVQGAIEQYKLGMSRVRTVKMFSYFTKTLEQTIAKSSSSNLTMALSVFETAHEKDMLLVEGYTLWIKLIHYLESNEELSSAMNDHRTIQEIIQLGRCGCKKDTWLLDVEYIKLLIKEEFNAEEILKYVKELPSIQVSIEFWEQLLLVFILNNSSVTNIYTLLELVKNLEAKASLRAYYLLHLGHDGIKSARNFYGKVSHIPPYSLKLHETMIQLETAYLDSSRSGYDKIRQCYEIALLQFGGTEPDLWRRFHNFEKYITQDKVKASYLHSRALLSLKNGVFKETFIKCLLTEDIPS